MHMHAGRASRAAVCAALLCLTAVAPARAAVKISFYTDAACSVPQGLYGGEMVIDKCQDCAAATGSGRAVTSTLRNQFSTNSIDSYGMNGEFRMYIEAGGTDVIISSSACADYGTEGYGKYGAVLPIRGGCQITDTSKTDPLLGIANDGGVFSHMTATIGFNYFKAEADGSLSDMCAPSCAQDEFVKGTGGAASCEPCSVFMTTPSGAKLTDGPTECTPVASCPADFYVKQVVTQKWDSTWASVSSAAAKKATFACEPCTGSDTNRAGDSLMLAYRQWAGELSTDPTAPAATTCDGPVIFPSSQCQANQRVSNKTCVDCAKGSTAPGGSDRMKGDTSCTETICPVNYGVVDNACVKCATLHPGETRSAKATSALGPNTECDLPPCKANERVLNKQCSNCAAGSFAPAGSEPPNKMKDTSCTEFICPVNNAVRNHVCYKCDVLYTDVGRTAKATGALGPDTECDRNLRYCLENFVVRNHTCKECKVLHPMIPGDTVTNKNLQWGVAGGDTRGNDTLCGKGYALSFVLPVLAVLIATLGLI